MTEEMPEGEQSPELPRPTVEPDPDSELTPTSTLEPVSEFDPSRALVEIKIDHAIAISFANALNSINFIQAISMVPTTGTPLKNIEVRLSITSLGQKINKPWNRLIPLLTSESGRFAFNQLKVEFNPEKLLDIEQLQPGAVIVEAFHEGEIIGRKESKVRVLPANAWTFTTPMASTAATLAAFVNPLDPAIDELITEATPRLRALGGDGWSGEQSSDPKNWDRMVRALYEALCARDIKYIDPPPSWELVINNELDAGQRIRTPTEVINGRFGTCLDTSVTFAALLEKIGLRPFLIVIPGHAQVGYWRAGFSGQANFSSHVTGIRDLYSHLDMRDSDGNPQVSLIESTKFALANSTPFSELHSIALQRIHGTGVFVEHPDAQADAESSTAVIDIALSRGIGGISVLPSKRVHADGTVEIISPSIQALSLKDVRARLDDTESGTSAGLADNNFPPRVKQWRSSLLDLSLNNPLIRMRKNTLRIAVPLGYLGTIEDLIQSGRELEISQAVGGAGDRIFADRGVVTDKESIDHLTNLLGQSSTLLAKIDGSTNFSNSMRKLVTAHKNSIEESGHNDLFLALGTLDWSAQSQSSYEKVQAPLFLVPIVIKSYNKSRNFKISIDSSSSVVPNYSLLEMLDTKFNFKLPKLENPDLDDFGIDIDGTIKYIRERVIEQKLDFLVDESAHIGTFDFSTYRLWRDITDNWKKFEERPLVKHLIYSPSDEYQGNDDIVTDDDFDLDDLSSELPIPVDGTQANAIHDALSGKSLIIEGPPGTGKSQTITNLLVKAIHDGKRVLFVAEKSAAVDVVVQRLSSIGMDNFFLDLHSKSARPSAVRDQLQAALARSAFPDQNGLEVERRAQAQAVVPLKNFPTQIHAQGKFGQSAYSSNDILMSIADGPKLTVTAEFLSTISREQLEEFEAKLDQVPDAGTKAGSAKKNRWSFSTLTNEEFTDTKRDQISEIIKTISKSTSALPGTPTLDLLQAVSTNQFLALGKSLATSPPTLGSVESHNSGMAKESFTKLITYLEQLKESSTSNPHASPAILDMPLDQLNIQLMEAKNSFAIGRGKKVNLVLDRFNSFFAAPVMEVAVLELNVLPHLKQIIEFAQFVKTAALSQPGITLPISWNPLKPEDIQLLLNQKDQLDSWGQVLIGEDEATLAMRKFVQVIDSQMAEQVKALSESLEQLFTLTHATEDSIWIWSDSRKLGAYLVDDANYWLEDVRDIGFASLNRWTLLYSLVQPLATNGAKTAALEILSETVPFYDSSNAFRRAFLEVVRLRQIREQGLETFDGPNHDRNIAEFNRSVREIRKFLPEQYAYDLIKSRGFDATVSTGAVGELARELNKVRGQKPVRALIKAHWKVLTRITPCVLASPSSVALFLDPELEPFDLVIFDEASQIKVPHAIGAIGRAKAAVIVGDSRQMPPSVNIGMQTKESELEEYDEDFIAPPDEESILSEGVMARLPRAWLSWHYRSEDESLIAFSNKEYYEGRLSSFPSPSKTRSNKGLSFIGSRGHFYRQADVNKKDPETGKVAEIGTNPIEARAIVAEITRRLNDPVDSKFSILVVTLNEKQATLIINLLADSQDERVQQALIAESDEPLMVKALEQVQGSERDIVLMSIGFSRNEKGVLPAHFGPLNRPNGHRRLNVAVTRARRQVLVYCSFEPGELSNKSQARGINDLQSFLNIAQTGDDSLVSLSHPNDAIDRHREKIADRLRERGHSVETLIGASDFKVDIAIMHPENPEDRVLGILLDNGPWNRRKTVIDRDTLPPEVLKNKMGWAAVERIWLPSWLKDPDTEISRIELVAKAAMAKKIGDGDKSPEPLSPTNITLETPIPQSQVSSTMSADVDYAANNPTSSGSQGNEITYWRPWHDQILGPRELLDSLPNSAGQEAVRFAMSLVLPYESPIEPIRAAKIVGKAYGIASMYEKRAAQILRVSLPGTVRDTEGFIYLEEHDPMSDWQGWRATRSGDPRKITEISLPEIGNAMRYLAIKSIGIAPEELFKETAQLFGIQRVTDAIKGRLNSALEFAISKGKLKNDGSHIVSGS
jgi:hypothetical protein